MMTNLCVYYRIPMLLSVAATIGGWWFGAFSISMLGMGAGSDRAMSNLLDDALAAVSISFCFLAGPIASFRYSLQVDLIGTRVHVSRLFGWMRQTYDLVPGAGGHRRSNPYGIESLRIQLTKDQSVDIEMWAVNYKAAVAALCD
jgi:hypothetical protein